MSDIQYKCPSCSAPIEWDPNLGKMACAYCMSKFEVEQVERFNAARKAEEAAAKAAEKPHDPNSTVPDWVEWTRSKPELAETAAAAEAAKNHAPAVALPGSTEAGQRWKTSDAHYVDPAELGQMRTLVCNSCGAEIVGDPTTISTRCGFCNNTFVATDRLLETRVPDFIIPFALDKKAMIAAFKDATKDKRLLPNAFRNDHTLAEATGAYIPYWFHDGVASGTLSFEATKSRHWSDSEYDYTETETYEVTREASATFRGIPVCATTKLEMERAEGTEPFDLAGSKDFATPYLSGYAASAFDIGAADSIQRADKRALTSLGDLTAASITGYDSVKLKGGDTTFDRANIWYALLPVWLIVIGYDGKKYPFAINGQTGEVVGDFPISKAKLNAYRAAFAVPFVALLAIITWFFISAII